MQLSLRSDGAEWRAGGDTGNFPAQFIAMQLFDKVAVLVRGLRLVSTDLGGCWRMPRFMAGST